MMRSGPNLVELLAPVGAWDVLEAAIAAGADAVYLGSKQYNMRMHRADRNFDQDMLAQAIEYARTRDVRVYVTVNNLVSEAELPGLREHLQFLGKVRPDALIIQDLAVLELLHDLSIALPVHASVMMNVHNEPGIRALQELGVSRVIASRDLSLAQLALIKERTGMELEYFIHGDMCIAHGGQCLASGVLFGQSSNRGRCLKPCRWPYQLVDCTSGIVLPDNDLTGPYKLAIKDMCMYRYIPDLIHAGITSFKIEGRMRPAGYIARIVSSYRRAIDHFLADPVGYVVDEQGWQELYDQRVRDYSTCYAFSPPGPDAIGYSGEREPMFFSHAVREHEVKADISADAAAHPTVPITTPPRLAVRVADLHSVTSACEQGADVVYVGGEAFKPQVPLKLEDIARAIAIGEKHNTEIFVITPRIALDKECSRLRQWFHDVTALNPAGLMVGSLGLLQLAQQTTLLPLTADYSFNLFNHVTAELLARLGIIKATISLELSLEQSRQLLKNSLLPLEVIVHGPTEAMVMEHCLPAALLSHASSNEHCGRVCQQTQFALRDSLGQDHLVAIDQYCRNHLLFAKDLCLLPYLGALAAANASQFRIEGQHYLPDQVALVTGVYRTEIDKLAADPANHSFNPALLTKLTTGTNRELGRGVHD